MRDRMPHAMLLQGRAGIGKQDFAIALTQSLLCESPTPMLEACGKCGSCNWFMQGNHPDFRLLEPKDNGGNAEDDGAAAPAGKKTQISVDQVRELADFFGLSSHRSGLRVVLLHPAEALNVASANALLKMLEEPPAGVLFLLVTHAPQRLLPTIRSRCSKVDMPFPERAVAERWLSGQGVKNAGERLAYAGGAPLRALEQDDVVDKSAGELQSLLRQGEAMNPFQAASACSRNGMTDVVDALHKWVHDLLGAKLAAEIRYHPTQAASLQGLAERVDLAKLLDFQRDLNEARRVSHHPLNAELQIESLMIQYSQLFATALKP